VRPAHAKSIESSSIVDDIVVVVVCEGKRQQVD